MSNKKNGVIYVGVTNNLVQRTRAHQEEQGSKFARKYKLKRLAYYEIFTDPENAIKREKQLKGGSRQKKVFLIEQQNPEWSDISGAL